MPEHVRNVRLADGTHMETLRFIRGGHRFGDHIHGAALTHCRMSLEFDCLSQAARASPSFPHFPPVHAAPESPVPFPFRSDLPVRHDPPEDNLLQNANARASSGDYAGDVRR